MWTRQNRFCTFPTFIFLVPSLRGRNHIWPSLSSFLLEDETANVANNCLTRFDRSLVCVAQDGLKRVVTRSFFGQLICPFIASSHEATSLIQLSSLRFGQVRLSCRHRVNVSLVPNVTEAVTYPSPYVSVRPSCRCAPFRPTTYPPVTFVQFVQHCQCLPVYVLEVLHLGFSKRLAGHFPDLRASLICLRFFRHPAQVRSTPFGLFQLLRQVRPSGAPGFHQPQLSQSVAQHSPPSRVPGHPGPVVRLCLCHFPDHPPQRESSARAGPRLSSHDITASQDFLLGALHELCPSFVHARRLFEIPAARFTRAAYDGWWQGFRGAGTLATRPLKELFSFI